MKTGRSSFLFLTMALASPTATWRIFSKALFSIEDAAIGVGLAICQSIIRAQGGRIQGSDRERRRIFSLLASGANGCGLDSRTGVFVRPKHS
jgi:hypothetical protein